ncbi:LOW QUALITY PROTEIN: phytanoyl-CoA dioxygenase, peroxisomal-like [Ciconia maguari]
MGCVHAHTLCDFTSYTLDNGVITTEQRQFYEDNGYLLIKKLISDEDIEHFSSLCFPGRSLWGSVTRSQDNFMSHLKCMKSLFSATTCIPRVSDNLSSRHPMHQDLHYFPFRPADRIVCSTAMERADQDTDCLVMQSPPIKFFHGLLDYDEKSPRVHVVMQKGDTVFFHLLLIHGSGPNNIRFLKECYYIDVKNMIPDHLEKEVIEFGHIKYKVTSASTLW